MRRNEQSGYSLLMVIFMVATMLILAAAVSPNLLTQGRRDRETETVWRGEQYERAIGMYFKKFGKYPTRVEDLTRQTNGVRFLRQAYTDPMNKDDGTWRFIYVGPNGQLIGSLRHTSLLQGVMTSAGVSGGSLLGGGLGNGFQPPPPPPAGSVAGAAPVPPGSGSTAQQPGSGAPGVGQTGQPTNGVTGGGLAPDPLASQPQPLQGAVIGGNIIGVGSKIDTPSIRVYEGGDTYQEWEFIWNPAAQGAIPGQSSANPTPPQGQVPGPQGQTPAQTPQVPGVNPAPSPTQ